MPNGEMVMTEVLNSRSDLRLNRNSGRLPGFVRAKAALVGAAMVGALALAGAAPASAQTTIRTIQQVSTGRFVDAYETSPEDYLLVTRAAQNNTTQLWRFTPLGNNVYTIQQVSNGRFVDAYEDVGNDYRVVTRPAQNNTSQRWLLSSLGNNIFTMQQVSSSRFVGAYEVASNDWRLKTSPASNTDNQRWRIVTIVVEQPPPPQVRPGLQVQPGLQLQPPAPVVASSGAFQLVPPQQVNLDNGAVGPSGADLSYQVVGFNPQLAPVNGAQISFTNGAQRGFAGCSAATFNNGPVTSLAVGNYACVRTSQNQISEFRVDNFVIVIGILTLSYTTWQ